MLEGLRLGFGVASKKIGRNTEKMIENLENCKGDRKLLIEVASPPLNQQARLLNPEINSFTQQDQANPLKSVQSVRKDMIGPRLGRKARPGQGDQPGRPYYGPGQARAGRRQLQH